MTTLKTDRWIGRMDRRTDRQTDRRERQKDSYEYTMYYEYTTTTSLSEIPCSTGTAFPVWPDAISSVNLLDTLADRTRDFATRNSTKWSSPASWS